MVKGLGKSRVATILLDIDYGELKQPLNQFNGLRLNRVGAWHLVKSFNKLSDRPIKDHVLERTFDKFWSDLEDAYSLQFPDSYEDTRGVQPIHIAPTPTTEGVLSGKPAPKGKQPKSGKQDAKLQPNLFNGEPR
jgi:hypothetical protein